MRRVSTISAELVKLGSALAAILIVLSGCGSSDDDSSTDSATSTTYTFATDIAPIIASSCASNGVCHGDNSAGNTIYVGNKAALVAMKTEVINRINGTGAVMPPDTSDVTLSSADKQKIQDYLNQSSHD